jgi:hypothetical protein
VLGRSYRSSLSRLAATLLVLLAAAFAYYLLTVNRQAREPQTVATSGRLLPQLPDEQFLQERAGLAVSSVNQSAVSVPLISADAAGGIALQHDIVGSIVNGTVLAQVVNLGTNKSCLCWIVSIHPGSALRANSPADPRPSNFDFEVIDARTGFAYAHVSGVDPKLPGYS